MIKKTLIIFLLLFCTSGTAQISETFSKADTLKSKLTDTILKTADATNSAVQKPFKPDSIKISDKPAQSISDADTAAAAKSGTLKISKRKYNHREQILFASVMMAFIAIIISSAQNWNPD